jgi:cell division protein FtsW (lipid II flippase)
MQLLSKIKELWNGTPKLELSVNAPLKGFGDMGENIVKKTKGDKVIWAFVIVLTLASLLLIYSSTGSLAYKMSRTTESYLFKQFALIVVGFLIIYYAHRIHYNIFSRVALIAFFLSIPLLIYTLFYGVELNAGSRWIKLPVINMTFQTSDFAKLALFMYLSRLLSKKQLVIKSFWDTVGVNDFDFMLDDGLHTFEAGSTLFLHSIQRLAANGIYIIEDVGAADLLRYKKFFSNKDYVVE